MSKYVDLNVSFGDFPGGPVAKNISCNAGDANLIPGQETKILRAVEQLSLLATTEESAHHNERCHVPQLRSDAPPKKRDVSLGIREQTIFFFKLQLKKHCDNIGTLIQNIQV